MFTIKKPVSKGEINEYYQLRWILLRRPLGGKKGSEMDDNESISIHRMIKNKENKCIGVGRAHLSDDVAQIRFMAILSKYQKMGLWSRLISELEKVLVCKKTKKIFLNSREKAITFYKKNGYKIIKEVKSPFGNVKHYRMEKSLI